ncbi:MAG: carbonic anhydrase [Nanoarchaeota archaeon]|nr:carbonic anhydrase [Nanoarchaeota archaeon]
MSETTHKHSAKTILKDLLEGNVRYAGKHSKEYENLKAKQTPKVTLLTCSDSRIPQNLFDIDCPNELFMVRNIGNQFRNSEGSIKYPLLHLNTPILIVMGHTGCGAIKASLSDYRGEDDTIQKEVIGLVNSIRLANQTRNAAAIPDEGQRLAIYAQVNVDHQINKIINEFNIKTKIDSGDLFVVGMMFDIHGVYGENSSHVYVTNINGATDVKALKAHDLAVEISLELSGMKFKRL